MQVGKRKTVVWSPHAGIAAAGQPLPVIGAGKGGKIKPPTYAQSVGWSDVFAVASPDSLRLFQITKGPALSSSSASSSSASHPSDRASQSASTAGGSGGSGSSGSASAAYAQAAAAQAQLERMHGSSSSGGGATPAGSSFVPAGTSVASVDLKLTKSYPFSPAAGGAGSLALPKPKLSSRHAAMDDEDDGFTPAPTAAASSPSKRASSSASAASSAFKLIDSITDNQQSFKCIAWGESRDDPLLISAALLSGKVVLFRFLDENKVLKEFVPKHARAANVLSWNRALPQHLAVGLDRVRNDYCTLIWDITAHGQAPPPQAPTAPIQISSSGAAGNNAGSNSIYGESTFNVSTTKAPENVLDPIGRVSNSEATLSLAWLPEDPHSLAVGTHLKWLRIYDIRGAMRPLSVVAHSKSVLGIEFDPFCASRFATFSEDGLVKLWDVRMLRTQSPLFTINTALAVANNVGGGGSMYNAGTDKAALKALGLSTTGSGTGGGGSGVVSGSSSAVPGTSAAGGVSKNALLSQIAWCSTRPALLATISSDESLIRLWDMSGSLANPITDEKSLLQQQSAIQSIDIKVNPAGSSAQSASSSSAGSLLTDLQPCRTKKTPGPVTSISWHPKTKQRILTTTHSGLVQDVLIHDSIPVAWSPNNAFSYGCDSNLFLPRFDSNTTEPSLKVLTDDVGAVMKRRAELGYSLNIKKNVKLVKRLKDPELLRLWSWMKRCAQISKEDEDELDEFFDPAQSSLSASTLSLANAALAKDATAAAASTGAATASSPLHGDSTVDTPTLVINTAGESSGVGVGSLTGPGGLSLHVSSTPTAGANAAVQFSASGVDEKGDRTPQGSLERPKARRRRYVGIYNMLVGPQREEKDERERELWKEKDRSLKQNLKQLGFETGGGGGGGTGGSMVDFDLPADDANTTAATAAADSAQHAKKHALADMQTQAASAVQQRLSRDIEARESIAQASSTLVDTGDHLLSSFKVYHNIRRSQALRVCGWFDTLTSYHCSFCALQPLSIPNAGGSAPVLGGSSGNAKLTANMARVTSRNKMLDFSGAGAGGDGDGEFGSGSASHSRTGSMTDIRAAGVAAKWKELSKRELKNLEVALNGHEQRGEFEKAAALALFHLDMNRALACLTRGASVARSDPKRTKGDELNLGLVALALSGYSHAKTVSKQSGGDVAPSKVQESAATTLWKQTYMATLQQQLKHPYLKAAFAFLLTDGAQQPNYQTYKAILEDPAMELRERIAFACRFLPDRELTRYLESCTGSALESGDLDGLLLTGLSLEGSDLIQNFVDRTSDVQSAALLASFALTLSAGMAADKRLMRWISAYRLLLNTWKLWSQRAKLDVARALLVKKAQDASDELTKDSKTPSAAAASGNGSPLASSTAAGGNASAIAAAASLSKKLAGNAASAINPQVFARCNFCSQPLSLPMLQSKTRQAGAAPTTAAGGGAFRPRGAAVPAMRGAAAAPHATSRIRGCPSCKKPLPRCALCLVSLDCATPATHTTHQALVKHTRKEAKERDDDDGDDDTTSAVVSSTATGKEKSGSAAASADRDGDMKSKFDDTSAHPFSQWFTWCQACRHGGHASHITEWFKTRVECPVTDCTCVCMSLDQAPADAEL